jgi:hypothetical protein
LPHLLTQPQDLNEQTLEGIMHAALKLVADCFGDEAAAVGLDPVGSRPSGRPHTEINPR